MNCKLFYVFQHFCRNFDGRARVANLFNEAMRGFLLCLKETYASAEQKVPSLRVYRPEYVCACRTRILPQL